LSERNLLIRGNELAASLVLPDDNSAALALSRAGQTQHLHDGGAEMIGNFRNTYAMFCTTLADR
jgi:hypothetical protein